MICCSDSMTIIVATMKVLTGTHIVVNSNGRLRWLKRVPEQNSYDYKSRCDKLQSETEWRRRLKLQPGRLSSMNNVWP